MIFLTVGTQFAFDRLTKTVDQWVSGKSEKVFGQIGPGGYKPVNFEYADYLTAQKFEEKFEECKLVVCHAGMGSILCALSRGKPILVMPRRANLGEHRNDHQMATARRFLEKNSFPVAMCEDELTAYLNDFYILKAPQRIPTTAPQEFIERLRTAINL